MIPPGYGAADVREATGRNLTLPLVFNPDDEIECDSLGLRLILQDMAADGRRPLTNRALTGRSHPVKL